MRTKAALLALIVLMATVAGASGRKFEWDPVEGNICPAGYTCGYYLWAWPVADYRAACPEDPADVLTDCDKDPDCTTYQVPAVCVDRLPEASKQLVAPPGFPVTTYPITQASLPLLIPGTVYVVVLTAFEQPPEGVINESEFSNRLVWKHYADVPIPGQMRRVP